jgi:hypothetical protein
MQFPARASTGEHKFDLRWRLGHFVAIDRLGSMLPALSHISRRAELGSNPD